MSDAVFWISLAWVLVCAGVGVVTHWRGEEKP